MEWIELVLTALGGSITGLIGSIVYFRPKLKEVQAGASKAETEASDAKVKYLIERVESVEKLYNEQGQALDEVRKKVLSLTNDVQEREQRIVQLEAENKALKTQVDRLEKEVEAYKIIKSGK